jgi:hypothetical protein
MQPRVIELCFQTAGLWEMRVNQRFGLPRHVKEVCVFRGLDKAKGPLYAVVTPNPDNQTFNAEVTDASGNRYLRLTGYRTVAIPMDVGAESLKALQRAA